MAFKSYKKICISAISGGGGKTFVSLGLARALENRGFLIKPFKKGPDYIDARWLTLAAKQPATNLDLFFMPANRIKSFFNDSMQAAENNSGSNLVALIEGNRGLFDGLDEFGSCSTAELCKIIDCPVIVTIDCTKMTRTIAAILQGIVNFEGGQAICGVILNKIGSSRHEKILRDSIEKYTRLQILGSLPRMKINPLPERHMGLASYSDKASCESEKIIQLLATWIGENIDLEKLLELAKTDTLEKQDFCKLVATFNKNQNILSADNDASRKDIKKPKSPDIRPKIGFVWDESLWFYYPENLQALEVAGCELIKLSLVDYSTGNLAKWKTVDGLYLGGGFPEDYAEEISNSPALKIIARLAGKNLPIYAECGGLIVLGKGLKIKDKFYAMAGILPVSMTWHAKPQGLGYVEGRVLVPNPFFPVGSILKGHEFHYSRAIPENNDIAWALGLRRGLGICSTNEGSLITSCDGLVKGNVWASYMHIFAPAATAWGPNFVAASSRYAEEKLRQPPIDAI